MNVRWSTAARLAWVFWLCAAAGATGQGLPSEPIALADGHVTVSGDVQAAFGCEPSGSRGCGSDPGFFNYTDYSTSALRLARVGVSMAVKAGPHFTFLSEVRTENFQNIEPYALYLRIRPWTARDFDLQVGRVPPTFGAFARRTYANDNPLIGYPLAYQYLTTIRPDSLPASADELLRKRSLGWLVKYSLGNQDFAEGVPLVTAFNWDTGIQAHGTVGMVSATASVTTGTVSKPLFHDNNDGRQFASRVEVRPVSGLIGGFSFARGPFVSLEAARAALGSDIGDTAFTQTAWGGDVEYSRDYYLLRAETIVSAWRLPVAAITPARQLPLDGPLRAIATMLEGRYKVRPDLYLAARYDHLTFSDIAGVGIGPEPWDAPVGRVEVGGGYSVQRNLVLKLSYQWNRRDGGVLPPKAKFAATQLVYWF